MLHFLLSLDSVNESSSSVSHPRRQMPDFDEFDDQDDLALAYLNQEQQQQPCDIPSLAQKDPAISRIPSPITPAKRDRKRSHSSSPTEAAGTVIRSMRPKIEVEKVVTDGEFTADSSIREEQQADCNTIVLGSQDSEDLVVVCEKKGGSAQDVKEESVTWPPSQTFVSDALKRQGSLADKRQTSVNGHRKTHSNNTTVKRETSMSLDVKPGKAKAAVKSLSIKRDEEGNVTETGKQEITKHLLKTLGDKHNPITNSDLYRR